MSSKTDNSSILSVFDVMIRPALHLEGMLNDNQVRLCTDPCSRRLVKTHCISRHCERITSYSKMKNIRKTCPVMENPVTDCQLDENFHDRLRWVDEEFYGSSSPTDDIWDKFELNSIHTPPMSPEHHSASDTSIEDMHVLFGDDLPIDQKIVNTLLGLNDKEDTKMLKNSTCEQLCGPLNTKLIQDCMWSGPGFSSDSATKIPSKSSSSSELYSNTSSPAIRNRTLSISGDFPKSSECVDPTAVFPYPLAVTPIKCNPVDVQSCMDTPSPSESEDEEEIDVVTVGDKSHCTRRKPVEETTSSYVSEVASIHNYSNTARIRAAHNHDHHYSAPHSAPQSPHVHSSAGGVSVLKRSRPLSMPSSPQPPSKRHRSGVNESDLKRVVQKLGLHGHHHHSRHGIRSARSSAASSRNSSDSEEGEGKRAQHNVLERKRRNDLKYSFCRLRACVPEIRSSERAPKVVILKKASMYVQQLGKKHRALESEYDNCKRLNEQLRKKIALLRKSDFSFI